MVCCAAEARHLYTLQTNVAHVVISRVGGRYALPWQAVSQTRQCPYIIFQYSSFSYNGFCHHLPLKAQVSGTSGSVTSQQFDHTTGYIVISWIELFPCRVIIIITIIIIVIIIIAIITIISIIDT